MKESFKARVIFIKCRQNFVTLTLAADEEIITPLPAQFYLLKVGDFFDPFLRRPLSVSQFKEPNFLTFRFGIRGRGTAWLSNRKIGEVIDLLGPLGNGFDTTAKKNKPLIIGGGLGIAPLIYLAKFLLDQGGELPTVVLGAKTKEELMGLKCFRRLGLIPYVATEDGSYGKRGAVRDILPLVLNNEDEIFACGPRAMLGFVAEVAKKRNLKCQVALEEVMACGVGACLGCAISIIKNGTESFELVCKDGPVFEASKVVW